MTGELVGWGWQIETVLSFLLHDLVYNTLLPNLAYFRYVKFLTKGDNNNIDDRGLYVEGQLWLEETDIIGRAKVKGLLILRILLIPRITRICQFGVAHEI